MYDVFSYLLVCISCSYFQAHLLSAFTDVTSCQSLIGLITHANNDQLTGSSHYNEYLGYDRSRLHTAGISSSSAWAAAVNNVSEYIQADFGTVRRLERVATQGRLSFGQWVTSYRFAQSINGINYAFVANSHGSDKIFDGNSDGNTVVQHNFDPALVARYVRLFPETWH